MEASVEAQFRSRPPTLAARAASERKTEEATPHCWECAWPRGYSRAVAERREALEGRRRSPPAPRSERTAFFTKLVSELVIQLQMVTY